MNITGAIRVINVPDDATITSARALIKSLEQFLAIDLPVDRITNVMVGSSEPEISNRDILWFKLDTAGNFKGLFVFVQGKWIQMFPHPSQIFRVYGDSREIEPGFALVTNDLPGFTAAMVDALESQWVRDITDTYWQIFDVVYIGL